MEAHELRLGNWVWHNAFAMIVTEILSPKPLKDQRFTDQFLVELYCDGLLTCTIDDIEPIKITEEILLKFGFVSNPYNDTYTKGSFKIYRYQELYFFRHIHLKYVHRLQNLFYEWTDQELTLETK